MFRDKGAKSPCHSFELVGYTNEEILTNKSAYSVCVCFLPNPFGLVEGQYYHHHLSLGKVEEPVDHVLSLGLGGFG